MFLRCSICDAEFPSAKAFRRQPVGKGKYRRLCPGCSNRYAESAFDFALVCSAILSVVGAGLIWAWPHSPLGCGLLFFGILYLTVVLAVLPHELGHALAALAVGMRLFNVTIGWSGRALFVRRIFGYDVIFRRIPLGGSALTTPKTIRFARLRFFVVVLSGPMVNVLLVVLGVWLINELADDAIAPWAIVAFICGNTFLVAISLFPMRFWRGKRRIPNDGLLLLQTIRMPRSKIEEWHSATFCCEAAEALERGNISDAERWLAKGLDAYPENTWKQSMEAAVLNRQRKHREARDAYFVILNRPELPPGTQANLWNNIAWTDLMIGDPTLLEEADSFSRQALEEEPWSSYIRGTRGSVLIELGQIEAGVRLVKQAFQENDRNSQALSACYLATAEIRQGNIRSALEYIHKARKRDPNCPLLERTMKGIERVTCTSI
jgi:Tfp pilus assembly protein PilF